MTGQSKRASVCMNVPAATGAPLLEQRVWLASYLKEAAENEFAVDCGRIPAGVTDLMMAFIGDPDPALRDDLICSAFYHWICKLMYYGEEELIHLLETALDQYHLLYKIGSREDCSVFVRTFSVLVVCMILYRHRQTPFLPERLFLGTKDRLLSYYRTERDLRGYVQGQGWAHGAAHGADALDELAQCTQCTQPIRLEILDAIQCVLCNGEYILHHGEDDRMATAAHSVFLAEQAHVDPFLRWIRELPPPPDAQWNRQTMVARFNTKNFLRSMYFKTMRHGYPEAVAGAILDAANKLS